MSVIGLLPASGSASRLRGLPKFAFPRVGVQTLLEWHVENMLAVCDEVRVCTRAIWAPLIATMELPIKLLIREPTTMSDALRHMAGDSEGRFLVGMPDTAIVGSQENPYLKLVESKAQITLAAFVCREDLQGHVGQIAVDDAGCVLAAADKDPACTYSLMWGALAVTSGVMQSFDVKKAHPGLQIPSWLHQGLDVQAVVCKGDYVDLGRPEALARFYGSL